MSGPQPDPRHYDLAEPRVGNADHLHLADLGMRVEKLLHFARIDVFAAADDHVARAAGDVDASVFAHHAQVAGVQPAVGLDHLRGAFGIAVVALHHRVAAHADFALLADGQRSRRSVGETILISVCGMARPTVLTRISMRVAGVAHGHHRRSFGLPVGDDQLADVHLVQARASSVRPGKARRSSCRCAGW